MENIIKESLIFEEIIEKYRYIIDYFLRHYFIIDKDEDDLLQIIYLGIFNGLKNYDKDMGELGSFLFTIIKRAILSEITLSNGKSREFNKEVLSIDFPVIDSGEKKIKDYISFPEKYNYDNKEEFRVLERKLLNELTYLERRIYLGYREGIITGYNSKIYDNGLERIKRKAKRILDKYYGNEGLHRSKNRIKYKVNYYNAEYQKEYRIKNKEKLDRYQKRYRKEKLMRAKTADMKEYQKKYYQRHKEKVLKRYHKNKKVNKMSNLLEDPDKNGEKIDKIIQETIKNKKDLVKNRKNNKKGEISMNEKNKNSNNKKELEKQLEIGWSNYGKLVFRKNLIDSEITKMIQGINSIELELQKLE